MIENYFYIAFLSISIVCLMLTDYRYRLAFWFDTRRTAMTLSISMLVFIVWDLIGIAFGVFSKGSSTYMLSWSIVPDFPLEELFFLFLLTYVTLLIYRGVKQC